jgi:hypothetical protein
MSRSKLEFNEIKFFYGSSTSDVFPLSFPDAILISLLNVYVMLSYF